MRIVLDLQACQSEGSRQRGIGRYTTELAKAMLRNRGTHDLSFLVNDAFAEQLPALASELETAGGDPPHLGRYHLPSLDGLEGRRRRKMQRLCDTLLNWQYACANADVLHVASVFEGWIAGRAHVSQRPGDVPGPLRSATLFDLIPLLFADHYLAAPVRPDYHAKLGVFHQLDLVLAISESARQDAIRHLGLEPGRVVNIRGASGASFFRIRDLHPDRAREVHRRHGLGPRFVLYTGGIDHRKNISGLIRAYARLPEALRRDVQLAIVCAVKPEEERALAREAARHGVGTDRLVVTGYIPDETLNLLYNTCEVFVFPSLYEGFGLPLLEAMTCGACVAASNTSSLPEIAGRQDVLFDPHDPNDIARVIGELLAEPDRRRALSAFNLERAREFSWDRVARDALAAFENAYARRQRAASVRASAGRRRLALFSPLPPQRSGIADYSASLLPHLTRHFDMDLIAEGFEPDLGRLQSGLRVVGAGTLGARDCGYDAILYHFGNSDFHRHMYETAPRRPGIVVMHDFFLSGLVHWMQARGHAPGILDRELETAHGEEGRAALAALRAGRLDIQAVMNRFPASRRIVETARGLIFHSRHAAALRAQFYPDLDHIPTAIVPMYAVPAPRSAEEREQARRTLNIGPGECLISTFGFIAETKQNHLLLQALASPSLTAESRLHIAFVGELPRTPYRDLIKRAIAASPHRERIVVTGYADPDQYRRYLAATDIAVSLRTLSRGETSAALFKNLAAGCPTIVSDYASFSELPDAVALKVQPDSASGLARALRRLIDDPELRRSLGNAGAAYVEDELHPAIVAAHYAAAIDELLARGAAQSPLRLLREVASVARSEGLSAAQTRQAAEVIAAQIAMRPDLGRFLRRE